LGAGPTLTVAENVAAGFVRSVPTATVTGTSSGSPRLTAAPTLGPGTAQVTLEIHSLSFCPLDSVPVHWGPPPLVRVTLICILARPLPPTATPLSEPLSLHKP